MAGMNWFGGNMTRSYRVLQEVPRILSQFGNKLWIEITAETLYLGGDSQRRKDYSLASRNITWEDFGAGLQHSIWRVGKKGWGSFLCKMFLYAWQWHKQEKNKNVETLRMEATDISNRCPRALQQRSLRWATAHWRPASSEDITWTKHASPMTG